MGIQSLSFPAGTHEVRLEQENGHFHLWATPQGLIATHLQGHGRTEFAEAFVSASERFLLAGQPIHIFHDWAEVTDYDVGVRSAQVQWVTRHRALIRGLHILVGSRILSIGVTTASMMLSLVGFRLEAYRERDPFERELRNALGKR